VISLIENFHRLAETPDAIPRFRRFILDLAVRGKLVEQDPNDEPASELLKRIQAEKALLVKAGEIKKEKPLPLLEDDEAAFDLPNRWQWVRIRQVTSDRGQTTPEKDFTYIDVTAINKEVGCITDAKILSASEAPSRARKLVKTGDVIYSCVRPYLLNIAVIERDIVPSPIASTAFAVLNGFGLVLSKYLWIVLRSPFMVQCVEGCMRGQAYPAINDSDFAVLPFPLPPLAEQHRIVAKVDELMALCDRLESSQAERENRRDQLTAASLHRLNNGTDADAFRKDVQFHLSNLPSLTSRAEHIQQLRKTILTVAVQGKLVPHGPKDKSASEFLLRVRTAAAEQDSRVRGNSEDDTNPKFVAHVPNDLPSSWRVCPLDDIFKFVDYRGKTPTRRTSGVRLITAKNVKKGVISNEPIEFIDEGLYQKWMTRGFPRSGDLLFVTEGHTMGFVGMLNFTFKYALAQRTIDLQPFFDGYSHFYLYYLMSEPFQEAVILNATGSAAQGIKASKLKRIRVVVPPLAEQIRIVAKVDELMALCDQIEAQLSTTQTESRRLLEAVLHEALA